MRGFALPLIVAALSAGSAFAQPVGNSLTLQNTAGAPVRPVILDGTAWKCSGGVCLSSGGKSQSAERACLRIVAKLGPVNTFTWSGETLAPEAVATCNDTVQAKLQTRERLASAH